MKNYQKNCTIYYIIIILNIFNYNIMNINIINYFKIRFFHLIELSIYVNNDLFNNIIIDHNNIHDYNELFLQYEIINSHNNKLYCIDKHFKIIDLNNFSLKQIAMMKINFNSFNIKFNNNEINCEYIEKTKKDIFNIIELIRNYHTNTNIYILTENKIINKINLINNDNSNIDKYIVSNIKHLINNFNINNNIYNQTKSLYNIYTFIYNNFNDICYKINKKFIKTVYLQLDKHIYQFYNNIYQKINENIIKTNEIELLSKLIHIFYIMKYIFIKTFSKDELDTFNNNITNTQILTKDEAYIKIAINL